MKQKWEKIYEKISHAPKSTKNHQKAPISTKSTKKHKKHQNATKQKHNNANKQTKTKNALKKYLWGRKVIYLLISVFVLANKKLENLYNENVDPTVGRSIRTKSSLLELVKKLNCLMTVVPLNY